MDVLNNADQHVIPAFPEILHPNLKDAATLAKHLGYMVASQWSLGPTNQALALYPLHRPHVIKHLKTATGIDSLMHFHPGVIDADLLEPFIEYAYRALKAITDPTKLSRFFPIIQQIAYVDTNEALLLADEIQSVEQKFTVGEGDRRNSQYAFDIAAMGMPDYVTSLSSDALKKIIDRDKFDKFRIDAFKELLKRNDPYADELTRRSPDELVQEKIPPLLLRHVYAQKLIAGNYASWRQGFAVGDDAEREQAARSIEVACQSGFTDSTNRSFVEGVSALEDKSFFEAIDAIIQAKLPLDRALDQRAYTVLGDTIEHLYRLDLQQNPSIIDPEIYIRYLCTQDPTHALKLWETVFPIMRQFFEIERDTYDGGYFAKSVVKGFAPLIQENMSLLDALQSTDNHVDVIWDEVRSYLFWRMIVRKPQNGSELIEKYRSGEYKAELNENGGLVRSLLNDFTKHERDALLDQPAIREVLMQWIDERKVDLHEAFIHLVRDLAQRAGISELAGVIEQTLSKLKYDPDEETYFVNHFLPEILDEGSRMVTARLEKFQEIREKCTAENAAKSAKFKYSPDQEKDLWRKSQVLVATLMEVLPERLVHDIIIKEMKEETGYARMYDELSAYAFISYHSRDATFVRQLHDHTGVEGLAAFLNRVQNEMLSAK